MDSDDEESTLYLHQENRIKAQEVTADEYAYYANYGEAAKESELGWNSGEALGRVRGYDSDTMSETIGCETACFAHKGNSRGDGSENDDDDSVITDNGEEDVEVTAVDDQQRPRTPTRDITRLTSYRPINNDSSDDTKSPPPQVKARYCFSMGATGAPSTSGTARLTGNNNANRRTSNESFQTISWSKTATSYGVKYTSYGGT